jgi:hypothetical protein
MPKCRILGCGSETKALSGLCLTCECRIRSIVHKDKDEGGSSEVEKS